MTMNCVKLVHLITLGLGRQLGHSKQVFPTLGLGRQLGHSKQVIPRHLKASRSSMHLVIY